MLAVERPEHVFGAEPELGSEGQMVQYLRKGYSRVVILERKMKRVRLFRLSFLLLKGVERWWRG